MSCTIWFTGLSGSGKTTMSSLLFEELNSRGLKVELFDGDIIRKNLGGNFGFSKQDRDRNVHRLGFVSSLLNKYGVISIVAAIAPYADARQKNRETIPEYVEVFCDCPLDVVIERDVKGLYKKALSGEIKNFTGISDPFEAPQFPDVHLKTDCETPQDCLASLLGTLGERNLI